MKMRKIINTTQIIVVILFFVGVIIYLTINVHNLLPRLFIIALSISLIVATIWFFISNDTRKFKGFISKLLISASFIIGFSLIVSMFSGNYISNNICYYSFHYFLSLFQLICI